MTPEEPFELIHGSGNVFHDFGYSDADIRQAKALLAAKIMTRLEQQELSLHQAESLTGVPRRELSRIAKADLSRFTLDRLLYVCNRLGAHIVFSLREEVQAAH